MVSGGRIPYPLWLIVLVSSLFSVVSLDKFSLRPPAAVALPNLSVMVSLY